jgi:hypothetical protein
VRRLRVLLAVGCGAALLGACAAPEAEAGRGPPDLLRWAATGDDCPPLTLLAGEYRRAVVEHDLVRLGSFVDEDALQCPPGTFIPAAVARRSLLDPASRLSAALFDGKRHRAAGQGIEGYPVRQSQAELLGAEELVVSVTNQAATSRLPRRARVTYRVAGAGWLEIGFECRAVRWVIMDWGGLECGIEAH